MAGLDDLGKLQREAAGSPLWAIRGQAIQAYANLEQSLCSLMAHLSGMDPSVAAIVFFKIVSTGARASILEKLLKKNYGTAYNRYWGSFEGRLREVDVKRNCIVHWNATIVVRDAYGDGSSSKLELMPPNMWDVDSNTPSYNADKITEFILECEFLCLSCDVF